MVVEEWRVDVVAAQENQYGWPWQMKFLGVLEGVESFFEELFGLVFNKQKLVYGFIYVQGYLSSMPTQTSIIDALAHTQDIRMYYV